MCSCKKEEKVESGAMYLENVSQYRFWSNTADTSIPETPSDSAPYDTGIRDYVLDRMARGDDIICGIFHNIDTAGHSFKFGESTEYKATVINCDMYAYSVLQAVKEREQNNNEEWLVVFANDHGGIGQGHGGQTLEERTTWIATNIPFDKKYFSAGYDGFNIQK